MENDTQGFSDRRSQIETLLESQRDKIAVANVLALLEIADAITLLASEIEKAGWSKMSWAGPE